MVSDTDFDEIQEPRTTGAYAAPEVISGITVPAVKRIMIFSPDEWEDFTQEWAVSLQGKYDNVLRYGGAGDMGCDVVGFKTPARHRGPWDNYQCKHYGKPLQPSSAWVEIGKIIYYSFLGEYDAPEKYYFVAPKGLSTSLERLIGKPEELKAGLIKNWSTHCEKKITKKISIPLAGDFALYLENFNFHIFDSIPLAKLIEGHSKTRFHATRFGGGLPERPPVAPPPSAPTSHESKYIQQLMAAYSEAKGTLINTTKELESWPHLLRHFQRSRELFYHAESLRGFARDNVPQGTFDSLQTEVYHGVVDVCESDYEHGLERAKQTVAKAGELSLTSNALCVRTQVQDRQGVCHQLVNDERLWWVTDEE